jgi:PEP-CTERM motif-containing protein
MASFRNYPSCSRPLFSCFGRAVHGSWLAVACSFALVLLPLAAADGEPIHRITIDGNFDDWASVPTYYDALGTEYHTGTLIPDVHDTDHDQAGDVPGLIQHPDVDIREYKFTHDENNLYAYFKATGNIGATQTAAQGKAGRYYAIVTIDVDNDDSTGYWLHEGGYFPTSDGYDMNMEAEFYDGQLNTAHYLSHDALNAAELNQDFIDLTSGEYPANQPGPYTPGFVQPAAGNYNNYTQWVYLDDNSLILVEDRGSIVLGIMTLDISDDGHEIEIAAPYKGFLNNSFGNANIGLGSVLDISFSLEASGELWDGQLPLGGEWASDTAEPIVGYVLEIPEPASLLLVGLASIVLATAGGRRR